MISIFKISNFLLFFNILLAFLCIRLPYIIKIPSLKFVILASFLLGFIFGVTACLQKYKKLTIAVLFFTFCLFLHAFCNFYQPSLRPNISFQNYFYSNNINSDFLFTQTRLYLMYFVLFIFPIFSFSFYIKEHKNSKYEKFFIILFLGILLINSTVGIYQGKFNLYFLADESLTSISAQRTPALLDDSGAAAFIFSIFSSVLLSNLFFSNLSLQIKIMHLFALFIIAYAGFINDSRSFYLGFFANLIIITLIKFLIMIKKLQLKNILKLTIFISLSFILIRYIYNNSNQTAIYKLRSFFNTKFDSFNFNYIFNQMDTQRYKHYLILIENLKDHFYTGSGVGSFLGNIDLYSAKLNITHVIPDTPTNLSLALISELGIIVGLFPLFLFTTSLIFGLWKIISLENSTENQLILPKLVVFSGIPFLFLSLTSYMIFVPALAVIACFTTVSPLLFLTERHRQKVFNVLFYILFCLSIYLIIICLFLAYQAKPIPSFQWEARGTPQIPVTVGELPRTKESVNNKRLYLSALLSPQPYLFQPEGASEGRWLKEKTEILLKTKEVRIYIGPQSRHFPVNIDVIFYSKGGIFNIKKYNAKEAGWVYLSLPDSQEFNSCLENISENSFCYYYIAVTPSWKPNFLNSIGFFIEDIYTN